MKNSKVYYMYRDAGNYKFFYEVVIHGKLSLDDVKPYFHDHDFFIPSELGWPDLQPNPLTVDDHIWHQVYLAELTNEEPTFDLSAADLIEQFRYLSNKNWNEDKVIVKKGFC